MTPAELADASFDRVMAKDREGWIALFVDNASVFDPVGPMPHDPEGKGFHGKDEIGQLWDRTIATFKALRFVVRERYVGGTQAATLFTVTLTPQSGPEIAMKGMAIHTASADGKMQEMRSYLIPAETRFPA